MLLKDSLIDDGDTLNIYPVFWRSFDRFNSHAPNPASSAAIHLEKKMHLYRSPHFRFPDYFYVRNAKGDFIAFIMHNSKELKYETSLRETLRMTRIVDSMSEKENPGEHPCFFFYISSVKMPDNLQKVITNSAVMTKPDGTEPANPAITSFSFLDNLSRDINIIESTLPESIALSSCVNGIIVFEKKGDSYTPLLVRDIFERQYLRLGEAFIRSEIELEVYDFQEQKQRMVAADNIKADCTLLLIENQDYRNGPKQFLNDRGFKKMQ